MWSVFTLQQHLGKLISDGHVHELSVPHSSVVCIFGFDLELHPAALLLMGCPLGEVLYQRAGLLAGPKVLIKPGCHGRQRERNDRLSDNSVHKVQDSLGTGTNAALRTSSNTVSPAGCASPRRRIQGTLRLKTHPVWKRPRAAKSREHAVEDGPCVAELRVPRVRNDLVPAPAAGGLPKQLPPASNRLVSIRNNESPQGTAQRSPPSKRTLQRLRADKCSDRAMFSNSTR